MNEDAFDLTQYAQDGIELCRSGHLDRGYNALCKVAKSDLQGAKLPSVFYSYLGLGMARYENRHEDGERLCKRAIDIEFYQLENYVNLAKLYDLMGKRKEAVETVRSGLRIDGSHLELRDMMIELGVRKRPVFSFLSRGNLFNRLLGRVRHDVKSSSRP